MCVKVHRSCPCNIQSLSLHIKILLFPEQWGRIIHKVSQVDHSGIFNYWALNVGKLLCPMAFCFFNSRFASCIASHTFASDMICCMISATAGSELKSNILLADSFSIELSMSLIMGASRGICSFPERLRPQPVNALQNGRFCTCGKSIERAGWNGDQVISG